MSNQPVMASPAAPVDDNLSTIENTSTTTKVIREDFSPELFNQRLAFVLHNVLSPAECAEVVRAAETTGFRRAMVRTGFKTFEYQPGHRESENCYLMDPNIREKLLQRVRPHLPQEFRLGQLAGLNERMTVLRYSEGGFFGEHTDGTVIAADDSTISFITVQLYLNQDFEGGETTFFPDGLERSSSGSAGQQERRRVAVKPRTGSAVVFEHKILHEGSRVLSGTKVTLRADVCYTRYYPPADASDAVADFPVNQENMRTDDSMLPPNWGQQQSSLSWVSSKCSVQ